MIDPLLLSGGGILACYGSTNIFKVGLGAALSAIIQRVTNGPSHIAILDPSGRVFQSTIRSGKNGPQFSTLQDLMSEYSNGGKIDLYKFLPAFTPHWDSLLESCTQMDDLRKQGKLCYGYWHLVRDLVARDLSGLPDAPAIERLTGSQDGVVCSEAAAIAMEAGGIGWACTLGGVPWLPYSKPTAGAPIGCAPADLIPPLLPIYQPKVQIV